jgi:phosphoglycolate phosphatase-like HAD superfamily hydrolase
MNELPMQDQDAKDSEPLDPVQLVRTKSIQADAYVFDIDGTVLVTRDLVHWNGLHQAMLEAYAVDTTIEGIPYHGKTDIGILRAAVERCGISGRAFEEGLSTALATVCREVSAHTSEIRADTCPGISELLSELEGLGKLLVIASGNLETVGWHKVTAANIREFFSFGSFGDCRETRAEIFDHAKSEVQRRLGNDARVCFIGDTPEDIRSARKVQAQIVAVATGTFGYQELSQHDPDACCRSCAELLGKLG